MAEEKKKGFFARLKEGLTKTRDSLAGRVEELVGSTREIDDDFYEELTDILIMADIGMKTTDEMIEELRRRVAEERTKSADRAHEILKAILKEKMSMPRPPLKWPMVMLVVGVNGVGKTTTIGKLALRFKDAQHTVMLAAADTFRAAAADQLEIWADRAQVPLVDTAGRLHNKKNLMEELRKMTRIIEREYPEAEIRTLLVIDATTGQNGLSQAREFNDVADISGIVLTKLDGTAKGGIAVAIRDALNVPVLYVGVGEGIDDLQAFDASEFVDAIF